MVLNVEDQNLSSIPWGIDGDRDEMSQHRSTLNTECSNFGLAEGRPLLVSLARSSAIRRQESCGAC
jgi:hypothetical protein